MLVAFVLILRTISSFHPTANFVETKVSVSTSAGITSSVTSSVPSFLMLNCWFPGRAKSAVANWVSEIISILQSWMEILTCSPKR